MYLIVYIPRDRISDTGTVGLKVVLVCKYVYRSLSIMFDKHWVKGCGAFRRCNWFAPDRVLQHNIGLYQNLWAIGTIYWDLPTLDT